MSFECSTCGETHNDLPELGFEWPDHYVDVPENERDTRINRNSNICTIDNEMFFIRGVLRIPLTDIDKDFGIGVWVSQKEQNFETYIDNFNSSTIGPFFGWLSNTIPFYKEDTINLKTMAHFQDGDQRPLIVPDENEHQLFKDYENGISQHTAWEYMSPYLEN